MDKKIAGLLGAAAALATVGGAHASTQPQSSDATPAVSYRDLLEPVPNAVALLKADDAARAQRPFNSPSSIITITTITTAFSAV